MQTTNILSVPLIDIIFDGRTKEYGAYELRKNYSKRINKALLVTMTLAGLICCSAFVVNSSKKNGGTRGPKDSVILTEIHEKKIEEPIPEKKPEIKPVKTEVFTAPEIKKDDEVVTPPPTQDELTDVKIGDQKVDSGDIYTGIPEPKDIDDGKKIVEPKQDKESDEPRATVDIPARFTGKWETYLLKNLRAETPIDNNAGAGRYTVLIQFVVDKEGNVSDIKALTNHGYGMEEEAMRVIKRSPAWEPAIFNGYKVKAYHKQPITFNVLEE